MQALLIAVCLINPRVSATMLHAKFGRQLKPPKQQLHIGPGNMFYLLLEFHGRQNRYSRCSDSYEWCWSKGAQRRAHSQKCRLHIIIHTSCAVTCCCLRATRGLRVNTSLAYGFAAPASADLADYGNTSQAAGDDCANSHAELWLSITVSFAYA